MARPPFKVTPALRRQVEELVSCGMIRDDIARAIGCTHNTLEKHFQDELRTGRSRKRAEVIGFLYKAAKDGNVSAQKKLESMTALVEAEEHVDPPPARPEKLGKKVQADKEAETAGVGTEWGGDLTNPPPPKSVN